MRFLLRRNDKIEGKISKKLIVVKCFNEIKISSFVMSSVARDHIKQFKTILYNKTLIMRFLLRRNDKVEGKISTKFVTAKCFNETKISSFVMSSEARDPIKQFKIPL